jgi:hypothetical protein
MFQFETMPECSLLIARDDIDLASFGAFEEVVTTFGDIRLAA